MTRNITDTFRLSAEASFSDEPILCFLTISHDTLIEPIRVVWDVTDFAYGDDLFIGFPFEITILSDDENPPVAQLTIQNVDPRIGDSIRLLNSPPRIKIELIPVSEFALGYNLLLHLNGTDGSTTITDSGGSVHVVTVHGNAQLDTSQHRYGTSSLLLDGTGDYLTTSASSNLVIGTDDFTISFSFRIPVAGDYVFYDTGNQLLQIWLPPAEADFILKDESSLSILDENTLPIEDENSVLSVAVFGPTLDNILRSSTPIAVNTWYHVEVTRASGIMRLFVDGIANGYCADATNYTDNAPVIGANAAAGESTNGWIDEVRLVIGYAFHTSDFIVPASQYVPNVAASPTVLYTADKLFLINVSVDIMQVSGQIVGWDYLQRVWPGPRATQAVFPGLFR